MRKLIITIGALLALVAFASVTISQTPPMSEEKAALYTKYYDLRKSGAEGRKAAYPVAKEFLQKFGSEDDAYVAAVRKFVSEYEKDLVEESFYKAYNTKEYGKAFDIGRGILKDDPENFSVLGTLVRAGYFYAYAGNNALNNDTAAFARRALEALETGKVTKPHPFTTSDEARGFINLALGFVLRDSAPAEAATAFHKAASISVTKDDPSIYFYLGDAILKAEYDPLSEEYKKQFGGKDESPEQKAMYDRLLKIGERAVDAYARSVALSSKPEYAKFRATAMAELTEVYKSFHNNSDAGLSELIANVLSKPLPD